MTARPVDHDRDGKKEIAGLRQELADALAGQVCGDGGVDGRCGSRIIESALLARLLVLTGTHSGARARLERFVHTSAAGHEFEHLVQLGFRNAGHTETVASRFFGGFRHSTGMRKQVVLAAVLALASGARIDDRFAATARAYRGHVAWTEVALCSVAVLHAQQEGVVGQEDRDFLVGMLRSAQEGRVWQGNVLAHVLALHALRTFDRDGPLLRDGIEALVRVMNPDGGAPFLAEQDIWVSVLAGEALSRIPRTARAARRVGGFIADHQLADGGWGYCRSATVSDLDDTTRCVALLHALDPRRYARAVARGRVYLLGKVGEDGGFATYTSAEPSEADLTAGAVIALAQQPASAEVVERAVDFLLSTQDSAGAFQPCWTRSESSVLNHVVQAWQVAMWCCGHRAAELSAATFRAVSYLVGGQNDDGGWGHRPGDTSDVISTCHAISLLAAHGPASPLARAIRYLCGSRGDGVFSSVPDQVGPRPLPYEYPILTEIHALAAVDDVLRRFDDVGTARRSTPPTKTRRKVIRP